MIREAKELTTTEVTWQLFLMLYRLSLVTKVSKTIDIAIYVMEQGKTYEALK
jgi:hypothetical protein